MITAINYALMAGGAYLSTRPDINKFPVPEGWIATKNETEPSGFEAVTFISQCSNEIVISFAGTGPFGNGDWVHGNFPQALGKLGDQLRQAADYYLQVKAQNPEATISFTGHSLGGGLASLMSVMFNESATTFDQAPFASSALSYTGSDANGEPITCSVAHDLLTYLQSETANGQRVYTDTQLQKLTDYVNALSTLPAGTIPNAVNVSDINVHGEILGYLPQSRIGLQADLWQQNNMLVPQVDLHSQALLTAFLQSGDLPSATQPADTTHTLGQVSYKLTDLLKMIFDPNLFYHDPNDKENPKENLLERIVKHEAGVQNSIPADAMVTRFTSDLWKLAQDGGMTLHDGNTNPDIHDLSNALIAFAMQKYYEEKVTSEGYKQELFTNLTTEGGSGGIRFDMADVSERLATALTNNQKLDLAEKDANGNYYLKGYQNLLWYLDQTNNGFTDEDRQLIKSTLSYMRDWYVQAGANGMTATDTQNRGAFMLGGLGADNLTGGTAADLLVGNAGNDTLSGSKGNDFMLGGTGNDTYNYTTSDGFDTILDSDGKGSIIMDDKTLAGGAQYGDSHVHRDADKHLYVDVGSGRMVIDGTATVDTLLRVSTVANDWPYALQLEWRIAA